LEEIITIVITDASSSTIHDSPIHVWVNPAVGEGVVGIGWDYSCNCYEIVRAWWLVSIVSAYDIVAICCA
jgi:hypothetical protein